MKNGSESVRQNGTCDYQTPAHVPAASPPSFVHRAVRRLPPQVPAWGFRSQASPGSTPVSAPASGGTLVLSLRTGPVFFHHLKIVSSDLAASLTTALSKRFPSQLTIFTNSSLLGLHLLSALLFELPHSGFCSPCVSAFISEDQPSPSSLPLPVATFQS